METNGPKKGCIFSDCNRGLEYAFASMLSPQEQQSSSHKDTTKILASMQTFLSKLESLRNNEIFAKLGLLGTACALFAL